MKIHFISKVHRNIFKEGDSVLKNVCVTHKYISSGSLGPKWEEPYTVIEVFRSGTYKLIVKNGKLLNTLGSVVCI